MGKIAKLSVLALAGLLVMKKRRENWTHGIPGRKRSLRSRILETGPHIAQAKNPLQAVNMYLNGFHFFADDMGHQYETNHYCTQISEDFMQCLIYDGNSSDSRLIGIEYIVSEKLFGSFPEEEKKLWHSHHYEVKSGILTAPNLPVQIEHELMKKIVKTYGKVWNTWDVCHHELPFGHPALMMAFTDEGQLKKELLENRDSRLHLSTEGRRDNRGDIPVPVTIPGANSWQTGKAMQLFLHETDVKKG